ncbi:hypothetical protein HG530_009383 [Fusarium avenaceum]|nr:hypothetical protein HG530_009383 [Fusarium avenaceum]
MHHNRCDSFKPSSRVVADAGFAGVGSEILAEGALLKVHILPVSAIRLGSLTAEVDTLAELPSLNTGEEEEGGDKDNGPLPGDTLVLEDGVADNGDVLDGEEGDDTEHDGPEEELVAPDVVHPLSEVELGARLHAEERSSLVNHLPSEEKGEPGKAGKGGGTGLEDSLTALAVGVVTVLAELTVAKGVEAEDEGAEAQKSNPETVENHVDDELERENTSLERDRGSVKDTSDGTLETETHVRGDGEDRETGSVLEDEADEKDESLGDVGGEHVENKLLDVVEDTATLLNSGNNRSEVIVTENNIGSILGDIGTGLTHGNTNIGTAERGRIVDTITSLFNAELVSSVESFDHADLGLRSTSGNNQRKERKLVDLIIGQTIELGSSHNHNGSRIFGNHIHAGSLMALSDSRSRLGTGRIVKTNETAENKITLNSGTVNLITLLHVDVVGLGSKSKDTETHASKRLHVAEDLLAELLGDGNLLLIILRAVSGTGTNDTLDSTLCIGKELVGSVVLHDDGHSLNVRVERKLSDLTVLVGSIVASKTETVPVKAGGKNLDGNFGRVTTGVPLAVLLVDGGKVGKGSDFEELDESRLALGEELTDGRKGTAVITTILEGKLVGLAARPANVAQGRVDRLGSVLDKICSLSRSPGSTGNHLTLSESTSLVRANIGNGTKSLKSLEVSDNNVSLNHALCTSSHGDSQDDNQTSRNHRETSSNSVDNNLLGGIEVIGGKDDDSTDNSSTEEVDCQSGQLLLERSADINTEETTNSIGSSKSIGFEVSVRLGRTIRLTLHGTDLAVLLSEGSSDSTNLGADTSSKDNTLSTSLGNSRGAVGDVDTVTGSGAVLENLILVLSNGERLTSQHSLISLEVNSLDQSSQNNLGDNDFERLNAISFAEIVVAKLLVSLFGIGRAETVHGISLKLLDNSLEAQGVSGTAHGLIALARDMVCNGLVLLFGITHGGSRS